jgi:LysW-gamma-L-lysine carboxypeptidase
VSADLPAELRDDPAAALLWEAVSRYSPSGEEGEVSRLLVDWMGRRDFAAEVDPAGNAVGRRGRGPLQVVLLGHIDTAPGWLAPRLEGGRLFGRGAVDAKGPFCSFLCAVSGLDRAALERMTLTCIGAVEEECPTSKGARYALTRYRPDLVLIGEPSGWQGLTLGYKGRLIARATVQRPSHHGAAGLEGAADLLVGFCGRAKRWAGRAAGGERPGSLFAQVQLRVEALNSQRDGLSELASADLGLRLPPGVEPEQAATALQQLAGDAVELSFLGQERAHLCERDSPLSRALRLAIRAEGGTPHFTYKTGTSDMNVVAPHWAVPMLAYGPGDSSLDHTPGEALDLDEYRKASAVLERALRSLAPS